MGAIEKTLLEIEKRCAEAFNAGDVDEVLKYFDEDVIGFSSTQHERLMGLDDMRETFLYYLREADRVEYSITSPLIKVIGEESAVVTYYWLVVLVTGNRRREIHGRGTHVFAKRGNDWKIVHEHFSRAHHGG
ncbi:MAG TPA: DUF3225 domain-containing protein [Bacteroidetes bacterium]|nr:DUF3225 domain-containing protein [Bacteroidota bacterium]